MRRSLLAVVLLVAGCTGVAPTLPAPTSSLSPADAKTLSMICSWNASVRAVSLGLMPLIAQYPLVSDHVAFKATLNSLRAASEALTSDPVSRDPWPVALDRRHPRDEFLELVKMLGGDGESLSALFIALDAWATADDLDPTSDLAAQLQQQIGELRPLDSEELGNRLCP